MKPEGDSLSETLGTGRVCCVNAAPAVLSFPKFGQPPLHQGITCSPQQTHPENKIKQLRIHCNPAWRELCSLLGEDDEAIVDAGRTEGVKLLRLRANLQEEDMTFVETLLAEKDTEREQAIVEKDAKNAWQAAEIARLKEQLAAAK